jgi:hypothetical protein
MNTAVLLWLPTEILDIVARQKNVLGTVNEETPTNEANVGYLRTSQRCTQDSRVEAVLHAAQRHRGTNTDEGGTLWDEDDGGCIAE